MKTIENVILLYHIGMNAFKKITLILIDTVFPPKPESILLREVTPENIYNKAVLIKNDRELPNTIVVFEYKDRITRGLLLELKNYGDKKACVLLAQALYDKLIERLSDELIMSGFTSPILIPIPVTRRTKTSRGWNQCELLALEIGKLDEGKNIEIICNALLKTGQTEDQVGKSKIEREKNLKGCFAVKNPELIKNKNIILLDDIITTGATMKEARKTLLEAGAKRVICLAVAH
jgi:ComF family protein